MIVVVGNPTLDISIFPDSTLHSFGGSATYSTFALRALGERAALVGNVGTDFPEDFLEGFDGIDFYLHDSPSTTTFELDYRGEERKVRNVNTGAVITSMPANLAPKAIHLGAVMGELSLELLSHLPDTLVSIDAQGVLRKRAEDGSTILSMNETAARFFKRADILKFSIEEAKAASSELDPASAASMLRDEYGGIVFVTLGEKGAYLADGTVSFVPAFHANTVDPTGAGDTFCAAFLSEYLKCNDTKRAARFASAAASFVVEKKGPNGFASRNDVLERMTRG